ncbi:hypothetical protein PIB30_004084 [Stylosanthes scabra]|uniref:Uncharacterized protein n=1 Tax=Stylosanthes scabra TaxID=79078 RepID=A0ABU6Z5I8_9FABA|nr:hypothetical protein [Stylosanthes scabra]
MGARSLLRDGIVTCSHARLRNLRTCTSPPSPLQVLPPFVSLEIHQLDSLQQPKLGAEWAHLVLHSPRNIGAVAGDLFPSLDEWWTTKKMDTQP